MVAQNFIQESTCRLRFRATLWGNSVAASSHLVWARRCNAAAKAIGAGSCQAVTSGLRAAFTVVLGFSLWKQSFFLTALTLCSQDVGSPASGEVRRAPTPEKCLNSSTLCLERGHLAVDQVLPFSRFDRNVFFKRQ